MAKDTTATDSDEPVTPAGAEGEGTLTYDDVDPTATAGFKPMVVIAAVTLVTFFLFGGGLPIYWVQGEEGYTLFTYGSVLWGLIVIASGFVFEYWVERNEKQAAGRTQTAGREA